jgi:hypothetical protein
MTSDLHSEPSSLPVNADPAVLLGRVGRADRRNAVYRSDPSPPWIYGVGALLKHLCGGRLQT